MPSPFGNNSHPLARREAFVQTVLLRLDAGGVSSRLAVTRALKSSARSLRQQPARRSAHRNFCISISVVLHGERASKRQPCFRKATVMSSRTRVKHEISLGQRLANEAQRAREMAVTLPAGKKRDALLEKARFADLAAGINNWLASP